MYRRLAVFALTLTCCHPLFADAPRTFAEAKTLGWKLYERQSTEFYCGCKFSRNRVDLRSCGYQPRKNANRAKRIEWEHIVTAWEIGHQRRCWQKGGRKNCTKHDSTFQRAEADLHNLVPSIGEINGDRSNFGYGWLSQAPGQYGACPTVVDFKARRVMPRKEVRGMIARTYLYMSDRYRLKLSRQNRQLYSAWNKAYPVQNWERQRNQMLGCVMGWTNPYVGQLDERLCRPSQRPVKARG